MDEKLLNALEVGKTLDTINRHKKLLYEQYIEDATFYYNGGRFVANASLISFTKSMPEWSSRDPDPCIIVLDEDNIPIKVEVEIFSSKVVTQYHSAAEKYYKRYQEVSNTIRDNSV